jgi:hypothetical protein
MVEEARANGWAFEDAAGKLLEETACRGAKRSFEAPASIAKKLVGKLFRLVPVRIEVTRPRLDPCRAYYGRIEGWPVGEEYAVDANFTCRDRERGEALVALLRLQIESNANQTET